MSQDIGHRAKRVKRENLLASKSIVQDLGVSKQKSHNHTPDLSTRDSSSSESNSRVLRTAAVTKPVSYIVKSGNAEIPISPRSQSQSSNNSNKRRRPYPSDVELDPSRIPSDPQGLRTWLAQQISYFQKADSLQGSDAKYESSLSSPKLDDAANSGLHLDKVIKRTSLRGESTRKKAFTKTRDQDSNRGKEQRQRNIRSSNSLGASKYSAKSTSCKRDELSKLGIDHRSIQQSNTDCSRLKFRSGIDGDLFISQPAGPEVREIGALLIKTFSPTTYNGKSQSETEAFGDLFAALKRPDFDLQSLVGALKILAKYTDVVQDVSREVGSALNSENPDAEIKDDSEFQSMQSTATGKDGFAQPTLTAVQQVDEIIRALNGATALLNQMADNKVYITPYGNPPHKKNTVNGFGAHNGTSCSSSSKGANGLVLDNSQIDAFLALANGGSLTDEDDDKTIADPDEFDDHLLDPSEMSDGDTDIAAILQRVISHFMATRNSGHSSDDRRRPSTTDLNGSPSIVEQATSLQSLFKKAEVSVNTIVPLAQGYATSQFYAHLSSHARSSISTGGINPSHTGTPVNPVQPSYRLAQNNDVYRQPQYISGHAPLPLYYGPRPGFGIPPPRMMDPEIQRKIAIYGCPPVPGSRNVSGRQ